MSLPSFGAMLTALSDRSLIDSLGDKECIAVINGAVFRGKIAVWRCPCQAQGDLEIWTAKELPESYGPAPNHSLIVSPAGLANSGMAGGDFDGYLNMISWDPDFVALCKETATVVAALDPRRSWGHPFEGRGRGGSKARLSSRGTLCGRCVSRCLGEPLPKICPRSADATSARQGLRRCGACRSAVLTDRWTPATQSILPLCLPGPQSYGCAKEVCRAGRGLGQA